MLSTVWDPSYISWESFSCWLQKASQESGWLSLKWSSSRRARLWFSFASVEYSRNFRFYQDLIVSLNICGEHLRPVQTKTRQGPRQTDAWAAMLFPLQSKNWILSQNPLCGNDKKMNIWHSSKITLWRPSKHNWISGYERDPMTWLLATAASWMWCPRRHLPAWSYCSLVQIHGEMFNRIWVIVLFIDNLIYPCYIMHSICWSYV